MIKRNTIQREIILQAVRQLKNHPTADNVYDAVALVHPTVSRGTVYRNLKQLSEEGILQRVPVPGGAERFDYQTHQHYHLKCLKCGGVFDVDLQSLPALDTFTPNNSDFQIIGFDIMFKGFCSCCTQNSNK